VLSIIVLILYIDHVGQSLRAAALIESVGQETREVIDAIYGDRGPDPLRHDPGVILAPESGVLFRIDYDDLVGVARDAGCLIALVPMIGDFVPAGAPLFSVQGDAGSLDVGKVMKTVALGPERTLNQDVAYGFRMLVDVAVRSLSDAFDPTTAVQAIDRLHDCLRQLARRPFPSGEYRDEHGTVRLRVAHITWDGYVRLAFDEIRQVGSSSAQATRRVRAALEDLLTVVPPERRAPLERQLALLDGAIAENDWPAEERAGVTSDIQGIGSAPELRSIARPA
jgi:uncharacterized membrane protein